MSLGLIILVICIFVAARFFVVYYDKMKFFFTGFDRGFTFGEVSTLWKLGKLSDIDEPMALYVSVTALNRAIANYVGEVHHEGIENTKHVQEFLSKLYKYRTKVNIEHENSRGLESTRYLEQGQKLRVLLPGQGVFASEILNNGHHLIIRLPTQNNQIVVSGDKWVQKSVSVYLWRKGDAGYVFDTTVVDSDVYNGQLAIHLMQATELLRTQKRKSVRAECNIYGQMYFITEETEDFNVVETQPGYKCLLEDISEDGALIRVGGKGAEGIRIKIQFNIGEKLIIMFGVVRAVEYNKASNQSRLHFESVHVEESMKNEILSFVYNVLPPEKREMLEALEQTEEDEALDETAPKQEASIENLFEGDEVKNAESVLSENSIEDLNDLSAPELERSYEKDLRNFVEKS